MANVDPKIQDIFARILGLRPEEVTEELSCANTPQWDSLRHIQLIMALEEGFGVQLPTWEIPKLTSVPAVCGLLGQIGVLA